MLDNQAHFTGTIFFETNFHTSNRFERNFQKAACITLISLLETSVMVDEGARNIRVLEMFFSPGARYRLGG